MSFALHAHETVSVGLTRIFVDQLHNARKCLANDGRLTDTEIHNARKSIKRARATLRLLRPALTPVVFRQTNLGLRDVARPLTHVRDAKVLLDSLDGLRTHFGTSVECLSLENLEQELRSQRSRARRKITASAATVADLRHALQNIASSAPGWQLSCDEWELLEPALLRIYRNARRAHTDVCTARSDERLHEWRKQLKHFWHALQILTPARPGVLGELAESTHRLTNYLGDDHDLALLRQRANDIDSGEETQEAFEALIDKRRSDLQDKAFGLGERILALKRKRFVRGIESSWREWHASAHSDSPEHLGRTHTPHGTTAQAS